MTKNSIEYFIVEGGHDGDPDPEEAGRIRTRQMGAHGKSVKTEHLPFNQTLKSGGNHFHRPPAPGTILAGYVPKGAEFTGYAHLLGAFSTKQESGVSAPGNEVLPFLDKAQNIELKIKLPPNVKAILEANRTGLQKFKKEIEEKGENFKQSTLRGLAGDGAIFALSGTRNTPLKNISTALDKVVDQISSDKLAQLPAGLGSLDLNSIIGQLITNLTDIDPRLTETLQSFVKTATGDLNSVSPPGGSSLGNIIDQQAYLTKALELMKDVKTSGDVIRAIQKLQHPDMLADTLVDIGNITFDIDSIYGKISQQMNAAGEIIEVANSFIDDIKTALQGILGGIPGTGIEGQSFFSGSGTPIPDLIERLKDTAGATALKEAVEKVSSTNNSKKAKQRKDNNGVGKGATQDIIFAAKQLIARDGRIVPFLPTDSNGDASGELPVIPTPPPNPSVANDDPMLVYSSFNAANVAFIHANSAFEAANAIVSTSNATPAFSQANSSLLVAQAGYDQANIVSLAAGGIYTALNAEITRGTSTYATLNAEIIRGTSTFTALNAESIRLTSAFAAANGALSVAQGAFAQANAAPAVAAYGQANIALSTTQSAFAALNAETARGTSTYATVNSESTRLTSAYATVNQTSLVAIAGYGQANIALLAAQGAFAKINTVNTSLGTAAFKNTGTSGATIPLLDGASTFSNNITITKTSAGNSTTPLTLSNESANGGTSVDLVLAPSTVGSIRSAIIRSINNGSNQIKLDILLSNADFPSVVLSIDRSGFLTVNTGALIGSSPSAAVAIKGSPVHTYSANLLSGSTADIWRGALSVSSYATVNAESIRLTSAFARANAAPSFYEEGTWTPIINFVTSGNLSVSYSSQSGSYVKIGKLVSYNYLIATSTFTHTTASGFFYISGLPYATSGNFLGSGSVSISGYTKAGYSPSGHETGTSGQTRLYVQISGSGVGIADLAAADLPTGGTVRIYGSGTYIATT